MLFRSDVVHSNYKIFQYKNSSVDQINLTCDFTAQDTAEATYVLAVIHFLRSVTKMFYGKDQYPTLGTPPPLCYLTGLGQYQFDRHPLAITSFTYTLPTEVDYIRVGSTTTESGVNKASGNTPINAALQTMIPIGGLRPSPNFSSNTTLTASSGTTEPTYVPTKIQIQIQAIPIVSRNDISNRFSLKQYATGDLLRGSKNNAGGIW